jgi:hypothetical protein
MSELYYHFVSANKRLRKGSEHEDIEVVPGLKLVFDGEPVLGERGFHASERPLDALYHAPSDAEWLCGVRLSGTIIHGAGKSVATERTVVWMLNVRKLLVEFALWNAEQAFEAIRKIGIEPDERSIESVRVLRLWLADKATKEELIAAVDDADAAARAAADAARAAADAVDAADAAYTAAYAAGAAADAARAAAYAARAAGAAADAVDAAYTAAYAADAAADAAARAAYAAADADDADAAARESQNEQLEKMIRVEMLK